MQVFHSEKTKSRDARTELSGGVLVPPFECPRRVDMVLQSLRERDIGPIDPPELHGMDPVRAVHDADYLDFLSTVWEQWSAAGIEGEVMPSIWPGRRTRSLRPRNIEGLVGYYALAAETAIEAHTFEAAQISADIALSAADHVLATGEAAFGLCRPPGHHAAVDQYGGYCFFNNAAIVAQHAIGRGVPRVAILDVDFHHGNGTQQIFYDRADVMYVSIHGDPRDEFPYYLGYADEKGEGPGRGTNANYPLPSGTDYGAWRKALEHGLARIREYQPALLVVSLGVDTFKGDPVGSFQLVGGDFTDYGRRIAMAGLPTVFLLEGGYAVQEIGTNVTNVLDGFHSVA